MASDPCQSYRPSRLTCADGFAQRPFCRGNAGCPTCGTVPASAIPDCLRDEVPEHLARPNGAPLFYREATDAP